MKYQDRTTRWLAGTAAILLLLLIGHNVLAAEPVRLNFAAAAFPEADEVNEQVRWSGTKDIRIPVQPAAALAAFGLESMPFLEDVQLWGAYGVAGIGDDTDGTFQHEQEFYLRVPGADLSFDVGVSRESNGEGTDEAERLRSIFARLNVGRSNLRLSLTATSIVDANDDVTRDVRTWGDAKEWGLSAVGQWDVKDKVKVFGDARPEWAYVGITTPGDGLKLFVYGSSGRESSLAAMGQHERAAGIGMSLFGAGI